MVDTIVLRSRRLHISGASAPRVEGTDPETGEVLTWADPMWRAEGEFYAATAEEASRLIASRDAKPLDLDPNLSRLARLAFAVCPARTAAEAAAAGVGIARVWHPVADGSHWRPAPISGLGPTRSAWEACFPSPEAARRFFIDNPGAVPLFSFHEGKHFVAFIWRDGGLIQTPTEVQKVRR